MQRSSQLQGLPRHPGSSTQSVYLLPFTPGLRPLPSYKTWFLFLLLPPSLPLPLLLLLFLLQLLLLQKLLMNLLISCSAQRLSQQRKNPQQRFLPLQQQRFLVLVQWRPVQKLLQEKYLWRKLLVR